MRKEKLYPKVAYHDFGKEITSAKTKKKIKKGQEKLEKYLNMHTRLEEFQQLSIAGSFDDAMIAYHQVDLTKSQKEILKTIHASTVMWARGELVDKILSKMNDANISAKDLKESVETMLRVMGETEDGTTSSAIEAFIITKNKGD